jgi:sec-independent protein translocase protein TatC
MRPSDFDEEEYGMVRMSFVEHLEEARSRILKALAGIGVSFALCTWFGDRLWALIARPAMDTLRTLGYPPRVIFTTPTEAFLTVWVKMPMLVSLFLAAPWIVYQVWAFVAPGLYRHERRWGAPFVIGSAGMFVLGGVFGYFVAFRYGLLFLLGIGKNIDAEPLMSLSEYFDMFVEVMVGIGLIFELPVLIFLLILIGVVTPGFLMRQSRYAVMAIVIVAALVTPTTDAFNLALFAGPMVLLYFVGVFSGYVLTLRRRSRPTLGNAVLWSAGGLLLAGGAGLALRRSGCHVARRWPFWRC